MRNAIYICIGAAILTTAVLFYDLTTVPEPHLIPPKDLTVRLLFTGDMMFDRGVARHAQQYGVGSLLQGVDELLHGPYDAVIGNLEGTITTQPSIAQKNNRILHFTFDPKYAQVVKDAGYTAVSQANNHALDFYVDGYRSTQQFLDQAGVQHFGSPNNTGNLTWSFTSQGKKVCVIGYHDLFTSDESPVIAEIIRIRSECHAVIVFPHWGIEYSLSESPRQRELAHKFIDTGADLVIGAHPHVVEPVEFYRGRAIFYSLGNFVFDQRLSFWTEHGLAVEVALHQNGTTDFKLIPTVLHSTEVSVATSTDEISKVLQTAGVPEGIFSLPRAN